ncbi:uncharacterized protein LOC115224561 [Argonauta hians]
MISADDQDDGYLGETNAPPPVPMPLMEHPASILSIVLGVYLLVIIIFAIIYKFLAKKGMCYHCSFCGGKGDDSCMRCIHAISEKCTCPLPSVGKCLDTCCPQRKQMDCIDIILCQCCAGAGTGKTCGVGNCKCDCSCDPGCNEINCLCFQLNFVGDNSALVNNTQPSRSHY